MRRVVVTGLGAITPIGLNVDEFWNGIKESKLGFAEITKFDASEYKAHLAAEVKGFVGKEYMDFKAAKRMELFSQYAVAAAKEAIEDSYKRLIEPSIEREIRSDLTEKGEEAAIDNFGKNLEALLLTPPLKEKVVLAFDPGYVNGCKLAVVDTNGKYLDSTVIKPFLNGANNSFNSFSIPSELFPSSYFSDNS